MNLDKVLFVGSQFVFSSDVLLYGGQLVPVLLLDICSSNVLRCSLRAAEFLLVLL